MSLRQRSKLPVTGQGSYSVPSSNIHSHSAEPQFPQRPDPIAEWIEDTNWAEEQDRLHRLSEEAAAEREELEYQAAVATSLGLPAVTPAEPGMSSSVYHDGLMTRQFIAVSQSSSSRKRQAAPITRHMNSDWMRPFEDNTKKSPVKRKHTGNPEQQFRLVFWAQVLFQVSFSCVSDPVIIVGCTV